MNVGQIASLAGESGKLALCSTSDLLQIYPKGFRDLRDMASPWEKAVGVS